MAQTDSQLQVLSPGDMELADRITEHKPLSRTSFAQYIRALMQNWRQGTVSSKDRGEVAFSNKKPWKQKGTGRARAGSRRSPLWRKGGTIFGPQPRVRTLKVSKGVKRNVLQALLWNKLEQKSIMLLDWSVEGEKPKTAAAYAALKHVELINKKIVLFVDPDDYITGAAFLNIPNVRVIFFDEPNAYVLADADVWVSLKKDADAFKEMMKSWI